MIHGVFIRAPACSSPTNSVCVFCVPIFTCVFTCVCLRPHQSNPTSTTHTPSREVCHPIVGRAFPLVLSKVSGNNVFAAHEIDSIEPSKVISDHEHVLLPPDRLYTLFPTNIKKNTATGLSCLCSRCRKDGLCTPLGYGPPLALPQRASETDSSLLCRLAQKSLINMTERPVKVVDVNIHGKIGGFHLRGDCSSKSFVAIPGHTVPTQHVRLVQLSSLQRSN